MCVCRTHVRTYVRTPPQAVRKLNEWNGGPLTTTPCTRTNNNGNHINRYKGLYEASETFRNVVAEWNGPAGPNTFIPRSTGVNIGEDLFVSYVDVLAKSVRFVELLRLRLFVSPTFPRCACVCVCVGVPVEGRKQCSLAIP